MANCLLIDCEYGLFGPFNKPNYYECRARVIFDGDTKHVTDVSHNHLNGLNNSHVQGIVFHDGQTIPVTPGSLQSFFPNLESLSVYRSGIQELKKEDLKGLNRLRNFVFRENNLETLESDLFSELPLLISINLIGNKLKVIEKDFFIGNPLLEIIDFSENPIKHVAYHVFDHLHSLRVLYFRHSSCVNRYAENNHTEVELLISSLIESCPPSAPPTASSTTYSTTSSITNVIPTATTTTTLTPDLTPGLILDCEYLLVDDVEYSCFARVYFIGDSKLVTNVSQNHMSGRGNRDVTNIYFPHNQAIPFTPSGIHLFFPNIELLDLSNCGVQLKREHLEGLKNLKYLFFNGNNLEVVESDLFIGNPLLRYINFQSNPIRHIAHNVFDHLHSLTFLDFHRSTCIDQWAAGRAEVLALQSRLIQYCPPTFEMSEAVVSKSWSRDQTQSTINILIVQH